MEVDVENFALITHDVPAARVRPHVPPAFALETFVADGGEETALVTTSCFFNRQVHWSPLRRPAVDFLQNTFRTYVTFRGLRGSYFFGTYVNTTLSWAWQGSLAAPTRKASITIDLEKTDGGYTSYSCTSRAGGEIVAFELDAVEPPRPAQPFATGEDMAQFITYRLHGFARSAFGVHTHGPVRHRRMTPWGGSLRTGRFDFWSGLDILEPERYSSPYSVLVEPSVHFTLHPPRPLFDVEST